MEIFSKRTRKLWNEWELRGMVLISLFLQITLIVLGKWRKYTARNWVAIVVWVTYLSADLVATVALGILCNKEGASNSIDAEDMLCNKKGASDSIDCQCIDTALINPDSVMMAFWAPFLLLHLGGPDTITAYSIEDNELWRRHLLGLIVQVWVASYVVLRTWMSSASNLTWLAFPVFIAGIIKYGERTWVLWSASRQRFRHSLLPPPSTTPTHHFVKNDEKHQVLRVPSQMYIVDTDTIPNAKIFHQAYEFFKIFRRLYADLPFNFKQIYDSCIIFSKKSQEEAFEIIEIELGFLYDVLYTKAPLVYSFKGSFIRSICFISIVSAFIGFLIIDKHPYSTVNVIISYVLLIGAIVLDVSTAILLLFSDWTLLWLSKPRPKKPLLINRIYPVISSLQLAISENKRWSHSMAQYNLIDHCLRHEPADRLGVYQLLENCRQIELVDISTDLKQFIFEQLQSMSERMAELSNRERVDLVDLVCSLAGQGILGELDTQNELGWSLDADFDTSIIIWHIATDLFYDSETKKSEQHDIDALPITSKISKLLSNYMLYLVVKRPFMLPIGIGQIRYQDTVAEAVRLFELRGLSRPAAIKLLHQEPGRLLEGRVITRRSKPPADEQDPTSTTIDAQGEGEGEGESSRAKPADDPDEKQDDLEDLSEGDGSKSVLLEGCTLAKSLDSLKPDGGDWEDKNKWDLVSGVWMEMLCHAASQCRWNQHAQQLGQGGELLTFVSLLMAHHGFTDQLKRKLGKKPILRQLQEFD